MNNKKGKAWLKKKYIYYQVYMGNRELFYANSFKNYNPSETTRSRITA